MKVKILHAPENPLKLLTKATLVSYWDEWNIDNLDRITEKDAEIHIPRVLSYGHESVLEHINVTWAVEGLSVVSLKQLTRHRHMSFTVRSQRYITLDDNEGWTVPSSVEEKGWKNAFDDIVMRAFSLYEDMVRAGIPKEDARFVLPQAVSTKLVVTMNMREFKHFAGLRMCQRAQWEIRKLAWSMWKSLWDLDDSWKKLLVWAKIGPRCITIGYCPERELMPSGCWKKIKDWWTKNEGQI